MTACREVHLYVTCLGTQSFAGEWRQLKVYRCQHGPAVHEPRPLVWLCPPGCESQHGVWIQSIVHCLTRHQRSALQGSCDPSVIAPRADAGDAQGAQVMQEMQAMHQRVVQVGLTGDAVVARYDFLSCVCCIPC